MRRTLVGGVVLLICMAALGLPALAANSGTSTVTGRVPLIAYDTQASGITDRAATISWRTNGNATSQVFYDTEAHQDTADYEYESPVDSTPELQHSVGLSGLSPATTYHYRVKSVATIGGGEMFSKGRDFGAWLGIVPKQISTGGRTILGRISKRGNKYLRMLFVQAARAVLLKPVSWERYGLKSWIEAAQRRLHYNKLAIALANKLARIAWAVLRHGRNFEFRTTHDAPSQPA